jgi:hypothetical protein
LIFFTPAASDIDCGAVPADFANMQADTISALAEALKSDEDVLNRGTKLFLILASNRTLLAFSTESTELLLTY